MTKIQHGIMKELQHLNNKKEAPTMKEFCIQVDVTMSGNIYVDANSKEEALAIVDKMNFRASDLTNFYQIDAQIVDIEE